METMHYSLHEFGSSVLNLGRCGEGGVRCIEVELREWLNEYPQAGVQLIVRQPGADDYLAAVVLEDGLLRWEIDRVNTAQEGFGQAELMLIGDGGECKKSATADIYVGPSLSAELEAEPPSPMLPWLAQMAEYAASVTAGARETAALTQESRELCGQSGQAAQEAVQAAQTAEEAVSAAQQAQEDAQASAQEAGSHAQDAAASAVLAQQAANAAGYVSFEIDADGQLVYTKTAGLELTFELSEGVLIAHG